MLRTTPPLSQPGPTPTARTRRSVWTRIAPTIAGALLLLSCWASWRFTVRRPGLDYYPIWVVVQWMNDGGNPHVRGLEAQRRLGRYALETSVQGHPRTPESRAAAANLRLYDGRLEPYATPFLYAALGSVMTGGYERDYTVFSLGSLLVYVLAAFLLARALGLSVAAGLVSSAALALPFAPFWSHLVTGNVGALQAAFLFLCTALLARGGRPLGEVVAGLLFALAVLLKPVIWPAALFMAMTWIRDRSWAHALRVIAGGLAGTVLAWGLGCAFFGGFGAWSEWLADLTAMLRSSRPIDPFNCSPLTALRAQPYARMPVLVSSVLAIAAIAMIGGKARDRESFDARARSRRTARATALGCGVALLVSPYSWLHYYVVAAPLALVLVADAAASRGTAATRAGFGFALTAALLLLSTPLHRSGLPLRLVELVLANVGLAVLVLLGLASTAAEQRRAPEST